MVQLEAPVGQAARGLALARDPEDAIERILHVLRGESRRGVVLRDSSILLRGLSSSMLICVYAPPLFA